ncbi:general secretion pathway protein GspB [Catenovulum sp. 2E275]|uniref:general secretion pathway protein GspB n=1 Tax=Catenovulum sp. 2E275 TaxID=2980497 RepID=UPI0021D00717|nr:general secretion pathway protein GspB [Catenovulum sp. 2E275]MCU4677158.1 general secretion pathway protein GspB [Catenovulum sp. 2E275]
MSFLMDALQKQDQNQQEPTENQGFAQDSADEIRRQKIKFVSIIVIALIITFTGGFYLAKLMFANSTTSNPIQLEQQAVLATSGQALNDIKSEAKNEGKNEGKSGVKTTQLQSQRQTQSQHNTDTQFQSQTEQQETEFNQPTGMTLSSLTVPEFKQALKNNTAQAQINAESVAQQRQTQLGASAQISERTTVTGFNQAGQNEPKNEQAETEFNTIQSSKLASEAENEAVSADLLARFNAAVEETMALPQTELNQQNDSEVPRLTTLNSAFQMQIPPLDFQTHIYSSDAKQGWVKVNNKVVREGQSITAGLVLKQITPQDVILTYQGKTFSLPALSSW